MVDILLEDNLEELFADNNGEYVLRIILGLRPELLLELSDKPGVDGISDLGNTYEYIIRECWISTGFGGSICREWIFKIAVVDDTL